MKTTQHPAPQPARVPAWSPWRTVVWFGIVSLSADMVYEGARSITGPYLAALGASALVVGVVTGAGEAAALVLRLVSGPLADRSGAYWPLTIVGYAMTAVCVPLMAVAPVPRGCRARLRRHDGAAGADRQGRAQPLEVGAARARRAARSVAARASRCTRRWTRSARSPARCWSPG